MDAKEKDDVVTFEELGVDRLFVDEADEFKNLALFTKMRNVGGINTSAAQKSEDMLAKCEYLNEKTDYHGVCFATGAGFQLHDRAVHNDALSPERYAGKCQHDRL